MRTQSVMAIVKEDTDFNESELPPVRKYTVKQRKNTLEDQKAVIDTFDSLIPSDDKLENLKNRFDLMQDIFAHTKNRTITN